MIINNTIIKNKYECNRIIAEYLIFQCKLPVLSYSPKNNTYYFTDNDKLKASLKNMPLFVKLQSIFSK